MRMARRWKERQSLLVTLGLAGAVMLLALASFSWLLSEDLLAQTTKPNVQLSVSFSNAGAEDDLELSYGNMGGASQLQPIEVGGVLNLSDTFWPLSLQVGQGSMYAEPGGLKVSAPTLPESSSCGSELTLSNLYYGKFALVNGSALFGPSTVSVTFGGMATLPATGVGIILPEPSGQSTSPFSPLLMVENYGSANSTGRLLYYEYNTFQNKSLQGVSPPFPLSPTGSLVLTVSFDGDGGFASYVNGQLELLGSIPTYSPVPQEVGVWTNSTDWVTGAYLDANGEAGYLDSPQACGTLTLLPLQALTMPLLQGSHPGARFLGPFADPYSSSETLFLLEAFTPLIGSGVAIHLLGAQPVVLPVAGSLDLEFAP